ncbi:DUF4177 domain-containing protein [Alkalihalobacillus sp. LMS39]|uniref:DUF4177 domain-containing protein n=1 Tax=Alkalihalobacillus sp. LMS39 TaxID=2924032 RepID=UPI001FB5316E|nr:DUF4177 domain-containing protein [Alkalihalobacillus sp. LMS39]UOE94765.1 DUF4177 domain-containing protein [Alkalihalobacillus sp. LMS39]
MYKYKFIKVKLDSNWKGIKPEQDYREIIEEQASNGWRFIQIFSPATQVLGEANYYELIFEKKSS